MKEGECYWLDCQSSYPRRHQNFREEGVAASGTWRDDLNDVGARIPCR